MCVISNSANRVTVANNASGAKLRGGYKTRDTVTHTGCIVTEEASEEGSGVVEEGLSTTRTGLHKHKLLVPPSETVHLKNQDQAHQKNKPRKAREKMEWTILIVIRWTRTG